MTKTQFINALTSFANKFAAKIETLFVKKEAGKGLSTNDFTTELKDKLDGIETGANNYVHPTTAGNKHIPAGGVSGQILRWNADGEAVWGDETEVVFNVDPELSETSTNAIQNKAVYAALAGKETAGAAATALTEAKAYTDQEVAALVDGAPETMNTLKEVSDALKANDDVVTALNAAIGNKASAADFTAHVENTDNPHGVTKAQVGLDKVENKTAAEILGEMTSANVTTALGFTPAAVMEDVTDEEIANIIDSCFA